MSTLDGNGNSEPTGPFKVLLCGASLVGNMGGPALYLSMVSSLRQVCDAEVTVLSKYPSDERAVCAELDWYMVSYPTMAQLIYGVPLSLLYQLFALLRLPKHWLVKGPFTAYCENDLLIDLSGISFTDDRSLAGLIINSLWLVPALATGIPWMKASQAMGPFRKWWVRGAARFFLKHAEVVVARGSESARFVSELLPDRRVYELPDVAFTLPAASRGAVDEALESAGINGQEPYCVVGPSYVVDLKMRTADAKVAYPELMARVVDELVALSNCRVVLIPHARATSVSPYTDLDVCESVLALCSRSERVTLLRDDLPTTVLKGIISRAEVSVGSRFHFMVAALSSSVPGLAISWSHKYLEMMRMLDQQRYVIDLLGLTEEVLLSKVRRLWVEREAVQREISERLPEVIRRAALNAEVACDILRERDP
jgi:polysaccharide pyruvyl transferase WcaK-like protein